MDTSFQAARLRTVGFKDCRGVASLRPPRGCFFVLAIGLVMLSGCRREADPKLLRDTHLSYETGLEQFRSQDYAGAAESLKFAIENGGLNSDSYETATVYLAECLARTGQASEALEILQKLEPGVCEFAAFHRVRSFVYEKLGQVAEANAEFRRAQGYQRNIQKLK